MLGSDVAALSSYRYSAHLSLSRPGNTGRTDANLSQLAGKEEKSQNLEEDELILRRKANKSSPETGNEQKGYELDATKRGSDGRPYTPEELKEIEELKKRDLEVRRHEQAHFRSGGRYASPPKYEFQTGPDGRRYAVGGSVDIDMSEVPDDPQATLEKARIVKRAALAPEEPSAKDRKVAREAEEMAVKAQKQISEERMDKVETHLKEARPESTIPATTDAEEVSEGTVQKVSVEPIDFPDQQFDLSMVTRYDTSRLEMSSYGSFRIAQLASPSFSLSTSFGVQSSLDVYV